MREAEERRALETVEKSEEAGDKSEGNKRGEGIAAEVDEEKRTGTLIGVQLRRATARKA